MRHRNIVWVGLVAAVCSFVSVILGPNFTVWPLLIIDGPVWVLATHLPGTAYVAFMVVGAGILFAIYTVILLAARGWARLWVGIAIAMLHALCAVIIAIRMPNPLY